MARTSPSIEQRTAALEQRVAVLESERPGRKPKPMLAIRQRDVCALDPSLNTAALSGACTESSIYRYQSGCHGAACRLKQHNAYERRKNGKAKAVKVPNPKKAPATKATSPKAAPTKRTAVNPKAPPGYNTQPRKNPKAPAKTVARRRITKAPAKRTSAA